MEMTIITAERRPLSQEDMSYEPIVPVLYFPDREIIRAHCSHLNEGNTGFILVNGLTGEGNHLTPGQRKFSANSYVQSAHEHGMRVLCCVQYPTRNLGQIVGEGEYLQDIGADALVLATPLKERSGVKPEDTRDCLDTILTRWDDAGVTLPKLLYINPHVSYPLSADDVKYLVSNHSDIIGCKNSGSLDETVALVKAVGSKTIVGHAGEIDMYDALLPTGRRAKRAHAIFPSMANLIPAYFTTFMRHIKDENRRPAKIFQDEVLGFINALYPGLELIPVHLKLGLHYIYDIGKLVKGVPPVSRALRRELRDPEKAEKFRVQRALWEDVSKTYKNNGLAALRALVKKQESPRKKRAKKRRSVKAT